LTQAPTEHTLKEKMEKRFRLSPFGPHLWTRALAREIREKLDEKLRSSNEGDVVILDLDGVEAFDFSFANELFGKTLLTLPEEYPGRLLVVENLTEYTRENLKKALEGLQLAMIERHNEKPTLLGKVHQADAETFTALIRAKHPITAAELKDRLEVNLTAMNERLSKLSRLGLVIRKKSVSAAGREQYEYVVPL
jgi:hypothetical protein